jgi:hypothetical protein
MHQVGRLGGDVETGAHAQTGERPVLLELLADTAQHWHLIFRPLDAAAPAGCQVDILNVVIHLILLFVS